MSGTGYRPATGIVTQMSKQLALSSALSVLAMSAFALFGGAMADTQPTSPASLISARVQTELLSLGSLLPGLR